MSVPNLLLLSCHLLSAISSSMIQKIRMPQRKTSGTCLWKSSFDVLAASSLHSILHEERLSSSLPDGRICTRLKRLHMELGTLCLPSLPLVLFPRRLMIKWWLVSRRLMRTLQMIGFTCYLLIVQSPQWRVLGVLGSFWWSGIICAHLWACTRLILLASKL